MPDTLPSLDELNRQARARAAPRPIGPGRANEAIPPAPAAQPGQALSLRQLNEAARNRPPAPPDIEEPDRPGAFSRGFVSTLLGQNPELVAEAFEGVSILSDGVEMFDNAAVEFRRLAALSPEEFAVEGQRLSEIGGIGEALTFLGEQAGSGIASMVPSLVSGTAGGALASRLGGRKATVAGSLAGAALPSAILNFGELFQGLRAEGIEDRRAAELALAGAGPITALDVGGVAGPVGRLTGTARSELIRSLVRRIASEAAQGALVEGGTEALQQIIQEGIAAFETGNLNLAERAENIGTAAIAGATAGGLVRAGAGAIPDSAATPAPVAEAPQALDPAQVESPEAGSVPAPSPGLAPNEVVTPRGSRITVQPEIVEAAQLITSHGDDLTANPAFPVVLQPRQRDRAASKAQVSEIANRLEPRLLGLTPTATDGAPIVGPDGVVESGNARTVALRRTYAAGNGAAYRAYLESLGFDLTGLRQPVLIRRRTTPLTDEQRQGFTREANERTTLGQSATEQATADANALPDAALDLYRGGDVTAAANVPFVRGFIEAVVPSTERGAVLSADGALSQSGRQRIENALFANAYGDPALLASLREDPDTNIAGIGRALIDLAPAWARYRANVARGQARAELDITRNVLDAAQIVSDARAARVPVGEFIRQLDLFGGRLSSETAAVLRLMFRDADLMRSASQRAITVALKRYLDQAERSDPGPGLLNVAGTTPGAILDLVKRDRDGALLPDAAEARAGGQPTNGQAGGVSLRTLNAAAQRVAPSTQAAGAGAAHIGFRADAFDPSVPAAATAPLRREAVIADLMKALDVPLYQGRIKSNGVLGFFRRPIEEVRVKQPADLEVTAHEIAHLIDSRIPEIRQQWYPASNANQAVRDELRGVSYDASKLYEGFAEFVRLWMTQTEQAQARAPQFFAWFEGFVGRHAVGPALRRAQQDMTAWFEQAALDRARSKIGRPPDINAFLAPARDQIRQSVFDDLHGILRMERDLRGSVSPGGAYETARLTRGKTAIIEGALAIGAPVALPDGNHRFEGKSLRDVLAPVADRLDDWLMYAVGRSSSELMGQGRERLFTDAEIRAMLALERPAFRQAFDDYQVWNGKVLDFAQRKGIINPTIRATWRRTQYVPFHRVGQVGTFSPVQGDWRGIKALTGGSGNLRDILDNMIRNAATLIDAALTNEARVKVARLAQGEGGAKFMARIPKEDRAVRVHLEEVRRAILEALGVRRMESLPAEAQQAVDEILDGMIPVASFVLRGQAPTGPNVVATMVRGDPVYYEVADPILYRSLTALNRPAANWLTRLLAVPKRIGQASITLTPDFMAANLARDTLSASIMSRHGFRPMIDSAVGLKSRLTQDQNYRDFIANGGGFSSYLLDEGAFKANLSRFYGRRGINYRTVLDTPAKLLLGLERIADAVEMSARLGEFRRARQQGASPRAAAFQAREVSTDFAMRGDSRAISFAYDTIIFLKAGMNGLDRFYRGLASDPQRVRIAAKAGLLALASAGLYVLNRGNPLYDELEDWDRDGHWHFLIPTPEALLAWFSDQPLPPNEQRYVHLRLPKIWEIGALASIAERQVEGVLEGQPLEAQNASRKVIADLFKFEWIPQAIEPLAELAINRERFTDRPVETQAMQGVQPFARSGPFTSQTARAIGETTRALPSQAQISPAQFEHLLRGYFNTWALYGLQISDAAFFDDIRPDLRIDQLPVVRRFFVEQPARNTRFVTELFDAIGEANETRRTMRLMDRTFREDIAGDLEYTPENLLFGQLQYAEERMRVFRRETELVVRAQSLADVRGMVEDRARVTANPGFANEAKRSADWDSIGALKRLLLDDLVRERNQFAREVIMDLRERREEIAD